MAYEYQTAAGVIRLFRIGQRWAIDFNGCQMVRWQSPDDAVAAAAYHQTGLPGWDRTRLAVPDDVLRWRPLGESL
jgi:hypothetical protein